VFGRTASVPKGAAAVCAPLTGCSNAGGQPGCFPAAATVTTRAGPRRMDELRVGDAVLAARADGSLEFQEVYFFGHRDAAADAAFVRLELEGGASLTLTPDHFVPVLPAGAGAGAGKERMTYARDVRPGDVLMVASGAGVALRPARVAAAAAVAGKGLFNPYTLGGTVVVDGVLASAHSSWLLDGAAAALGLTQALPATFQALFAPLRVLYALTGPAFMEWFGDALAAAAQRFEAAALSAAAGGAAAAAPAVTAAAVALGAAAVARKQRRA
jgi:hedgehog protein